MTNEPRDQESVQLRILWRGMEDVPMLYANQFVVQHEQDELILTVGQIQPPILVGTPQQRVEQARQLGYLPVNVVARLAMTRTRMKELVRILQDHLDKFDESHRSP